MIRCPWAILAFLEGQWIASPFARFAIESIVTDGIGPGVLFPANVSEGQFLESGRELFGFLVQFEEFGILHAVFATHLFHHQFAVAENRQPFHPQFGGELQTFNEGGVFRDVVGGVAYGVGLLDNRLARASKYNGVGRWSRISPRCSINVHGRRIAHGMLVGFAIQLGEC